MHTDAADHDALASDPLAGERLTDDPRRRIPKTDVLLASPQFASAVEKFGPARVKAAIVLAQQRARGGDISPDFVAREALSALPTSVTSMRAVLNATGVVVHTNIGRAPLSTAAQEALVEASGYVDVEFDVDTAKRARRGRGAIEAMLKTVPDAQDALVVNNGAAALLLACLAVGTRGEVLVSRGELVEIGDGFRLPEMLTAAGVRLREVGTTNRTHVRDYQAASEGATAILKVHTSNYRVEGFAGVPGVEELAALGIPVIADVGSGLLRPERALPDEPDVASWLRAGASVVTASGDKLLGGPQAGLLFGSSDAIERIRRHPLARPMRADKLALAALEATLIGPIPPVLTSLRQTRDSLRPRTERLAKALAAQGVTCHVQEVIGRVGGGGGPGVDLPSLALGFSPDADRLAWLLRTASPGVLARVADGRCLIDLRCIPETADAELADAIVSAVRELHRGR